MFKTPVICLGASLLTMFAIPASASEVGEVSEGGEVKDDKEAGIWARTRSNTE